MLNKSPSKGGLFSHRNECNFIISRSYSTSTKSNKWDLYSAVCLERKPIILKPLNPLEKKVLELLSQTEVEKSYKSDHEIKGEMDVIRKEEILKNPKALDLSVLLEQTAHEFEEISNKEFDAFRPTPLVTVDDKKNNVRSLNRELSNHLLLLVKEKIGDKDFWLLPQGIRKDSETLRETAERVLREKCGDNLSVSFLGNAPCGFYKWFYPKRLSTDVVGGKVFFFKAFYLSGQVDMQSGETSDYQWATRKDLRQLLIKLYRRKVSKFLIPDDDAYSVNGGVEEKDNESVPQRAQQRT